MRILATGLLVAMAALYAGARLREPASPAWGFVRAFAEAAMVGGLADWFAVTALFRHPLGLPVPHTAIIPRNKDRIGDTLAKFMRDNFIAVRPIHRQMNRLDVARAVARWLTDPADSAGGRFRAGASKLVAQMLEALDPARLGGMLKGAIRHGVRSVEVAPLLGQLVQAAIAGDRHRPLINGAILWVGKALEANEQIFRQMIHERAGSILRWTGLDGVVANKILDGIFKLLGDMAEDPHHPLRTRADQAISSLAERLQHDPALQAKVVAWRDMAMDDPAVGQWLDGLWEQARAGLLAIARDPERAMAGPIGELLRQLGATLERDRRLARTIDRFARRVVISVAVDYRDNIVRIVSETVSSWDTRTITDQVEKAVGRDLQYIRVNGTLVGGLVGLGLHLIDVLA